MRDRWPSWKAPIVGTRPIVRSLRRSLLSDSRSSATVVSTFIRKTEGGRRKTGLGLVSRLQARPRGPAGRAPLASTASRWRSTVSSSPRATGPVSARSGPRRAQFSTVWRTRGTKRVAGNAGGCRHLLRRRLERHEEVGGDRRRGVVGGPGGVGQLERPHAKRARDGVGGGERARRRPADGTARAVEAPAVGGERLERMEAERVGARGVQRAQRRRAAGVARRAAPSRRPRRRRRRSRRRARRAATASIGAAGASPRPSGPATSTPAVRERVRERGSKASAADDGDALRQGRVVGRRRPVPVPAWEIPVELVKSGEVLRLWSTPAVAGSGY